MKKILLFFVLIALVGCTKPPIEDNVLVEEIDEKLVYDSNEKFITANFVDLDNLKAISKFRSCSGHEYSRFNIQGEREPVSSMKHYLVPKDSFLENGGKIAVYAPFDGVISRIDPDDTARGRQFIIEHKPFKGWMFTFFHIDILPIVKEGNEVKAGDLLGYGITPGVGWDFDIALQFYEKKPKFNHLDDFWSNTDQVFSHMVDEVFALYEERGITRGNIVISKEYRGNNPCDCDLQNDGYHDFCNFFTPHDDSDHYFPLEIKKIK